MDLQKYFPNRVRAQFSTNDTGWNMIATDGTGYATYAALVAAGKTPFPGAPTDFPTGVPQLLARTATSAGNVDGDTMQIITNTINTPAAMDDLISGSGQTLVYTDDSVKNVWVKKKAGTDIAILTGFF